jgi:hypothetical protein
VGGDSRHRHAPSEPDIFDGIAAAIADSVHLDFENTGTSIPPLSPSPSSPSSPPPRPPMPPLSPSPSRSPSPTPPHCPPPRPPTTADTEHTAAAPTSSWVAFDEDTFFEVNKAHEDMITEDGESSRRPATVGRKSRGELPEICPRAGAHTRSRFAELELTLLLSAQLQLTLSPL